MSKLTIMRGLPASGKSTKAQELLKVGNTVRINKDLLRTMLHFDNFTGRNEGFTKDAARLLADSFLIKGVNVIIDDTNLNEGTVQGWKDLAARDGAKIEYVDCTDVSVDECIERDYKREKRVGKHVIQKMAMQHLGYLKGENAVICDLDGTLCDIEHRLHFAHSTPKDWKSFFAGIPNDSIRMDVLDKVLELEEAGNKIILVSARPETYREATEAWLENAFSGYPLATALIMREAHDKRPDTEVKKEIYEKYLKNMNIIKVFDDRPSVIRMWRELGLNVEDVGKGVEF